MLGITWIGAGINAIVWRATRTSLKDRLSLSCRLQSELHLKCYLFYLATVKFIERGRELWRSAIEKREKFWFTFDALRPHSDFQIGKIIYFLNRILRMDGAPSSTFLHRHLALQPRPVCRVRHFVPFVFNKVRPKTLLKALLYSARQSLPQQSPFFGLFTC